MRSSRYKLLFMLPVVLLANLSTFNSQAGVFAQSDLDRAYAYLNTLRQQADMVAFTPHPLLQLSSFNHANYLTDNFAGGHFENNTLPGFTGTAPSDRAIFAGFSSRAIGENLSTGSVNSLSSIDGLFTAIYHRFGFLSFDHQLIGIGIARTTLDDPQHTAYVYETGNQGLNDFCAAGKDSTVITDRFFIQVCANASQRISEAEFNQTIHEVRGQNPNIVVWPARNATDVSPAFFEEDPDPLPDKSVAGNPISIQFNPLSFSSVGLNSFRVFKQANHQEIAPTRLLDSRTDPNQKFSALEFALYPLERLEWNTEYRVEASYTANDNTETLSWHFCTRDLGAPVITTAAQGENFIQPAQAGTFVVYMPPSADLQVMTGYSSRFSNGIDINIDIIDGNTLKLDVNRAQAGQFLEMKLSEQASFVVQFSHKAAFNTANNSISLPAVDVISEGNSIGRVAVQMLLLESAPQVLVGVNGAFGAVDNNTPTVASYDMLTSRLNIPALDIDGQSLSVTLDLVADSQPLQFKLLP